MGAVSKLRKGFDMKSPTNMKSDNGKGTGIDSNPGVSVKSMGTNTWGKKQTTKDAGTNKSGGKMDFAPQEGLSTMGKKQPKTDTGTNKTPGKMDKAPQSSLNTWGIRQPKTDSGTAGSSNTVKTNFPLAKDKK